MMQKLCQDAPTALAFPEDGGGWMTYFCTLTAMAWERHRRDKPGKRETIPTELPWHPHDLLCSSFPATTTMLNYFHLSFHTHKSSFAIRVADESIPWTSYGTFLKNPAGVTAQKRKCIHGNLGLCNSLSSVFFQVYRSWMSFSWVMRLEMTAGEGGTALYLMNPVRSTQDL